MSPTKRQEIERKIVRFAVRTAKKHGWQIAYVNDGNENVKCHTETAVLDAVFSVDESHVVFTKPNDVGTKQIHRAIFIVLGNSGYDCIADNSVSNPAIASDNFNEVMEIVDAYAEKFEE